MDVRGTTARTGALAAAISLALPLASPASAAEVGTADHLTGAPPGERFLRPVTAHMSGLAEVDASGTFDRGDRDGTGVAAIYISEDFDVLCYTLEVRNIAPATAAHIHVGPVSAPGPVVQPLEAPTDGSSQACTAPADGMDLEELVTNPQNYYVNVHNEAFPPGAVRGQTSVDSFFDYVVDRRGRLASVPGSLRTGPIAGLTGPAVGVATTQDDLGVWVASAGGGVYALGTAPFLGSAGDLRLNAPIVGMAATPTGLGYWLAAADGGVFAFGDAGFFGSAGAIRLNQPVVDIAGTPTGRGYWLVAADGGVFAFGDAGFHGSMGGTPLNRPVVAINAEALGGGYTVVASDGGVFAFGEAQFHGSTGGIRLNQPIVDMTPSATGGGYRLLGADGGIFAFGDAEFLGSATGVSSDPLVAID